MSSNAVTAVLLEDGLRLTSAALVGYSRFAPHSFKVGSSFGFVGASTDTDVRGALVYTGTANLISAKLLSADTVRYSMTLPEGVGPFAFGNVMLFATNFDGSAVPFAEIILPISINKIKSVVDINNANPYPKPGSRVVISLTIKHQMASDDATTVINVTVTTPAYANLAYFDNETLIPPPLSQPWSQFVISNHTRLGSPAVVAKRPDQTYWSMPLMQNLQHPMFGTLNGGVSGDAYQQAQHGFLFGQFYNTPTQNFSGVFGGGTYADESLTLGQELSSIPY